MANTITPVFIALALLLIAGLFIADHPRLLHRHRSLNILLDRAVTCPDQARELVAQKVSQEVISAVIEEVNFVNDSTIVTAHLRTSDTVPSSLASSRAQTSKTDQA